MQIQSDIINNSVVAFKWHVTEVTCYLFTVIWHIPSIDLGVDRLCLLVYLIIHPPVSFFSGWPITLHHVPQFGTCTPPSRIHVPCVKESHGVGYSFVHMLMCAGRGGGGSGNWCSSADVYRRWTNTAETQTQLASTSKLPYIFLLNSKWDIKVAKIQMYLTIYKSHIHKFALREVV